MNESIKSFPSYSLVSVGDVKIFYPNVFTIVGSFGFHSGLFFSEDLWCCSIRGSIRILLFLNLLLLLKFGLCLFQFLCVYFLIWEIAHVRIINYIKKSRKIVPVHLLWVYSIYFHLYFLVHCLSWMMLHRSTWLDCSTVFFHCHLCLSAHHFVVSLLQDQVSRLTKVAGTIFWNKWICDYKLLSQGYVSKVNPAVCYLISSSPLWAPTSWSTSPIAS